MADREKVINGLTAIHDEAYDRWVHCQYTQDKLLILIDKTIPDALELLKEQKPVQVIQRETMHMLFWCCGSCGVAITEGDKFCRMCGRTVKWNE